MTAPTPLVKLETAETAAISATPSRRRAKRPSYEQPEPEPILPSARECSKFIRTHHSALLATFVVTYLWFGRVIAPLAEPYPSEGSSAHTGSPRAPSIGLTLATGSAGLFLPDVGIGGAWRGGARAVHPTLSHEPHDFAAPSFGLFLATGSAALSLDVPPAVATPTASLQDSLLPYDGAHRAPRPPSRAFREPSIGMALATGSAGILLPDVPDWSGAPVASKLPLPSPPPPRPTEPVDPLAFALTCAAAHTAVVLLGFAIGHDTLSTSDWQLACCRASLAVFCLSCLGLWWGLKYNIGPVPPAAIAMGFPSGGLFVVAGGLSMTVCLGCSMLVPHSGIGRACARSHALHGLIMAVGALLTLV